MEDRRPFEIGATWIMILFYADAGAWYFGWWKRTAAAATPLDCCLQEHEDFAQRLGTIYSPTISEEQRSFAGRQTEHLGTVDVCAAALNVGCTHIS